MSRDLAISAEVKTKLLAIADLADQAVQHTAFADYQELKANATLDAQKRDLANFTDYLNGIYERAGIDHRIDEGQLFTRPELWAIISAGLVETFKKHLANNGFSVASINRHLSTIRTYARLAMKAGVIDAETNLKIKSVGGYLGAEAKNFDEKRKITRIGNKKEKAVLVDELIIKELKKPKEEPRAIDRRDRLVLCLILDHGLRASEVAGLQVGDLDVVSGYMAVYRKKTKTTDNLKMTLDTRAAARDYLENDALTFANEPLILSAKKGGSLKEKGVNRHAVSEIMKRYGRRMAEKYGLPQLKKLSAHDGRSQWTTDAIRAGTPLTAVQQAGGWKSPFMVHRYAEAAEIVNEDVKLDR